LEKYMSILTDGEINLLCYVIPQAPRVVGNWDLTALIFQSVLKKPVEFDFVRPQILQIPSIQDMKTEGSLGIDTVMGNEFRDEFPVLKITIKGITARDLTSYLPLGDRHKIIADVLCSYFIALDVPYEICLQVTEDSLGFQLDENVLGFNTCLN
jgi:predicted component of type VI protein secretion system